MAANKRARDEAARSDRVELNVGGQIFCTTRSTLTGSSSYFERMWSTGAWSEVGEDTIFLDRDGDVFRILLSAMRSGPGSGIALLPRHDQSLCVRIFRDSEYFGIDWLLTEVKIAAQKHLHATEEDRHTVTAFNEEHGGTSAAILAGVLPDRCFGPPEIKPAFPRVKQLVAASQAADVCFKDNQSDEVFQRQIACYALVEKEPNGATSIEPVVARRPGMLPMGVDWEESDDIACDVNEQLMIASDYFTRLSAGNNFDPSIVAWCVRPHGTSGSDTV